MSIHMYMYMYEMNKENSSSMWSFDKLEAYELYETHKLAPFQNSTDRIYSAICANIFSEFYF